MKDKKEFQDLDLDDILSEFSDEAPSGDAADFSGDLEDILGEWDVPAGNGDPAPAVSMDTGSITELIAQLEAESEADAQPEPSTGKEAVQEEATVQTEATQEAAPVTMDTGSMNALIQEIMDTSEGEAAADVSQQTIRVDALPSHGHPEEEDPAVSEEQTIRMDSLTAEEAQPEASAPAPETAPRIISNPRIRLRELKRKLVAGPEKRYYELSETGVGRLQIAIILNLVIVALCMFTTTLYTMGLFPANRLRFLVFSQILAMLLSALMGCHQMLDGLGDLFKGRFTINTLLSLTFAACCTDAVFCLSELRIPCCAAFSLEITMALWARYQRRTTEMSQMDTMRKAVRLHAIIKSPDFYDGKPGILRREGEVEDFMDQYNRPSGPEKLQSAYSLISFLASVGIAVYAGMIHGVSMGLQILSTSLLVSVPASFFVSLTRPAALLERRLHLVGTVLCGWRGVKKLCGKAAFPLKDEDLFPAGTTKLNGVKFYGTRDSDEVIAYATSLVSVVGGSLAPVFQQMLSDRDGKMYPVSDYVDYGKGGIGGSIRNESVLLGSMDFLQDMGVDIPDGTMVNQAVYVAIDGELCAVFAITYAKMRSCTAGLISLCGNRKITPVLTGSDFMLTGGLLRARFSVNTRRIAFPSQEIRQEMLNYVPQEDVPTLALATRNDLSAYAYAVSGARALRTASRLGAAVHLIGGIFGLLTMAVLAYLGATELLTPTHVLLYQLVWMVPGLLITEWTRTV